MVYRQISQRSLATSITRFFPILIPLFVISASLGFILAKSFFSSNPHEVSAVESSETFENSSQVSAEPSSENPLQNNSETPPLINLQPVLDRWLTTVNPSHVGVVIYDLDHHQTVAKFNSDKVFETASLYKLFVAYEGYRRLEHRPTSADDLYVAGHTRAECLDLMIRVSDSACAEKMHTEIGSTQLNHLIKTNFGLAHSPTLSSTPSDIAKMLTRYYFHPDLSAQSWQTIKDSMLNQPNSGSDRWRQGFPAGFSRKTKVYNKVGWNSSDGAKWDLFNDAAILEFSTQNRHYAVAIMTNFTRPTKISALGSALETALTSKK